MKQSQLLYSSLTLLNLGDFTKGLKPLIVGLLIMVVGQALGGTTGFALNPARDWAPRFAYSVLPVPNKVTQTGVTLGCRCLAH